MRTLYIILLLLLIAVSVNRQTMAEPKISGGQITVVIGTAIQEDPKKVQALHDNHVMNLLENNLKTYIRRSRVRPTLEVHISITEFILDWGKDSMSIEVQVNENGEEIARFSLKRSTVRNPPVLRLTKALAKQTFSQLKKL